MTAVYSLPERLERRALATARSAILALRGADLDLEGSSVSHLGRMGLKFLLSAFQAWRKDGRRLRLIDPSPCLLEAFVRLSLATETKGEAA